MPPDKTRPLCTRLATGLRHIHRNKSYCQEHFLQAIKSNGKFGNETTSSQVCLANLCCFVVHPTAMYISRIGLHNLRHLAACR